MDLNFFFGLSASLFFLLCDLGRITAQDNFGLLYGTLRTFQAHACDGEDLHLSCTNNTIISINFVRYGRQEHSAHLCPGFNTASAKSCHLESALKIIEERCRGAVQCHLQITPHLFSEDPCPGIRKYAEVAYKCKPENFRNKVVCEGQRLDLNCPRQSIVIYSAIFGTSEADILECPRTDPARSEDCLVSYATETVIRICSRREECSITADVDTFGNLNCGGRKYLKVTYSCVDSKLLVGMPNREKTVEGTIHTTSFPAWMRGLDHSMQNNHRFPDIKASTESSNSFKLEIQSDEAPTENNDRTQPANQKFVSFLSGWVSAHKYVEDNKHKFILYIAVSLGVGFLAFLTVLGIRLFVIRRPRKSSKLDITPDTEDQFFSDSDLEQFDPPEDLPPAPMTNYTSLRRHDSDAQPRAPITTGPELNHYFS